MKKKKENVTEISLDRQGVEKERSRRKKEASIERGKKRDKIPSKTCDTGGTIKIILNDFSERERETDRRRERGIEGKLKHEWEGKEKIERCLKK